ncbi:hypothetical protein Syun_028737 [Stephania yunnanensis]|uniref:C3H1-type domain-containing protein n=1 Tax=Stephania yunnanensis TaxID=152371 RepID=A0AAP0E7D0_9MAGN
MAEVDEGAERRGASSAKSSNSTPSSASPLEVEFQRKLIRETNMLTNRFNSAFYSLRKAFAEVGFLREENLKLRTESLDLSALVAERESQLISSISRLSVETKRNEREVLADLDQKNCNGASKAVPESRNVPKVISVRSNGFLALNKGRVAGVGAPSKSRNGCKFGADQPLRLRLASQGNGEREEIELEVYNQGMLKTELCNKWEETGDCPYADRCQFAHGIKELRPVIRHPRYKTEICRMISSGGTCPYGHRCHFRHSLDSQAEKELVI